MFAPIHLEIGGEFETGRCDCCGRVSRKVWGEAIEGSVIRAVYFIHWTVGHVVETGTRLDLILGPWNGGGPANRFLVQLDHRICNDGPQVMVIDAVLSEAMTAIASHALCRSDVIGTPLASEVFEIYDAIVLEDERVSELMGVQDT